MDRQGEIRRVIEEILRPLLEADGGGIELVELEGDGTRVSLRLTGLLRGDPAAGLVKEQVIAPVIAKASQGAAVITYVL
jgi:hypothetical protein